MQVESTIPHAERSLAERGGDCHVALLLAMTWSIGKIQVESTIHQAEQSSAEVGEK